LNETGGGELEEGSKRARRGLEEGSKRARRGLEGTLKGRAQFSLSVLITVYISDVYILPLFSPKDLSREGLVSVLSRHFN